MTVEAEPIFTLNVFRDNAQYDPSQTAAVVRPPNQEGLNVPINITLGNSWFEGYQTLPAKWVLDVPLQHFTVEQSVQFAQVGLQYITPANLQSIEIGNEPDLYGIPYQDYVDKFKEYAVAISGNITSLPASIYQGLTISSGAPLPPWDVPTLFDAGIDTDPSDLTSVSYHYYQTFKNNNISTTLLNHTDTVSHLSVFKPSITYLQSNPNTSTIPFVLGEIGSALNGVENGNQVNDFDLEGVLGSAIWTVDFLLYAASIGVSRVSMQQITGGGYDGWQPVEYNTTLYGLEQPATLPPYYGYLFVADFIGPDPDSNLKIYNVDLNSERASAYAGYEGGNLTKIALVNTEYWLSDWGIPRPTQTFTIAVPEGVTSVAVDKLLGPDGAGSKRNITWAGDSYGFESGGKPVHAADSSETFPVNEGLVRVEVPAVEAWLLKL